MSSLDDDPLAKLIAALEDDPRLDIENYLRERPERATALRSGLARLRRAGLLAPARSAASVLREMHERFGLATTASAPRTPSKDPAELLPSRIVGGRYQVLEEIGCGGMGRVFRARDVDLGRDVALKVIDLTSTGGPDDPRRQALTARFLAEARVTAQLEHPSIVPLHDIGTDRTGELYYTMKLVEGRTLDSLIGDWHADFAAGRAFPTSEFVRIVLQICDALALAHERGVIHRDLKPSNVMIGRFGEVHVMDWGLAKSASAAQEAERTGASPPTAANRTATAAGSVLGTPSYMAPEQARGDPTAVDHRVDVYGVGAILRRAMTAPRGSRVAMLPPEVEAICRKATAEDPAARFQDVGELAADLKAYLDDRVVRAYQVGPVAELRKWTKRNRRFAAALGIAAAAVVVGLGSALWIYATGRRDVQAEEAATRRVADVLIDVLRSFSLTVGPERQVDAEELVEFIAGSVRDKLEPRDRARLQIDLVTARVVQTLGNPGKAEQISRDLLATSFDNLDARARYEARQTLALSLLHQSRMEEGERALVDCLIDLRDASSLSEADLALVAQFAQYFHDAGRATVADTLDAAYADVRARSLSGPPSRELASTIGNLTRVMMDRGRYEDARRLSDLLADYLTAFPETDELRIRWTENRARTLQLLGHADDAEELFESAVALRAVAGPMDPNALLARQQLAQFYAAQDRYDEAEPIAREVLDRQREAIGPEHPDYFTSLVTLGEIHLGRNRLDEALHTVDEALRGIERRLGREGESYVMSLDLLGRVHTAAGRAEEAVQAFEEAAALAREALPETHPLHGILAFNLGRQYWYLERFEDSYEVSSKALDEYLRMQGPEGAFAQPMRRNLALASAQTGRFEQAAALFEEYLSRAPADSPAYQEAAKLLDQVYADMESRADSNGR